MHLSMIWAKRVPVMVPAQLIVFYRPLNQFISWYTVSYTSCICLQRSCWLLLRIAEWNLFCSCFLISGHILCHAMYDVCIELPCTLREINILVEVCKQGGNRMVFHLGLFCWLIVQQREVYSKLSNKFFRIFDIIIIHNLKVLALIPTGVYLSNNNLPTGEECNNL